MQGNLRMNETINPVVYGQPNCQFCTMAVNLLKSNGYVVEYKSVGKDLTKEEYFAKFPGVRSVPMIELNGKSLTYPQLKDQLGS